MSDKNLNEKDLSDLRSATEILEKFSGGVLQLSDNYESKEKRKKAEEKKVDLVKNAANALDALGAGFFKIGTSMASSPSGSFAPLQAGVNLAATALTKLTSDIPIFGKIVESTANSVAGLINFTMDLFQKQFQAFQTLADSGVVQNFDSLREISKATQVTMSDLSVVLGQSNEALAHLGGNTIAGVEIFKKFSSGLIDVRTEFIEQGRSHQQLTKSQLNYLALQNMTLDRDNRDYNKMSKEFVDNLDTTMLLSRLTGEQLEELEQNRISKKAELRMSLLRNSMPLPEFTAIENATKYIESRGAPTFAAGIKHAIAFQHFNAGTPNTKESLETYHNLQLGGVNLLEVAAAIRKNPAKAMEISSNALDKADDYFIKNRKEAMVAIGKEDKMELEMLNWRASNQGAVSKQIDNLKAQSDKRTEAEKKRDKELADSRERLNNESLRFENFLADSTTMKAIMENLSSAMDTVIGNLYDFARQPLPDYIEYARKYSKAIETARNAQIDIQTKQSRVAIAQATVDRLRSAGPTDAQSKKKLFHAETELKIAKHDLAEYEKIIKEQNAIAAKNKQKSTDSAVAEGVRHADSSTSSTSGTPDSKYNPVLRAIGGAEGAGNYNITYGDRLVNGQIVNRYTSTQDIYKKSLTEMTIQEVLDFQKYRNSLVYNTGAMGKYQFISTTLSGLVKSLGIPLSSKFDGEMQERLEKALLDGNTRTMINSGIPADIANQPGWIYMSHYLGAKGAALVYAAMISGSNSNIRDIILRGTGQDVGPQNDELKRFTAQTFPRELANRMAKHGAPGARSGGIFSGPSTGYLTILHGDEIVIPVNNGQNTQLLKDMLGLSDDSDETIDIFSMISDRVSDMISLVETSNYTQRRITRVINT